MISEAPDELLIQEIEERGWDVLPGGIASREEAARDVLLTSLATQVMLMASHMGASRPEIVKAIQQGLREMTACLMERKAAKGSKS